MLGRSGSVTSKRGRNHTFLVAGERHLNSYMQHREIGENQMMVQEAQLTARLGVIMRQAITIRGFSFRPVLSVLLLLAMIQGAWSQNVLPTPPAAGPAGISAQSSRSVLAIGGGDLLKVSVFGAPESDQEVRVDQEGNISLNFIGSVHVAGLTASQAQDLIAKKLVAGGFFTQPQVSVFAKEYATQGVSVLGEVQHPGVYALVGARRLFDVLSLAGGTSQKAGKMVSITHRDRPEAPVSLMMSNDPNESAKSNVEIFGGDTIVVSKAGVVYIVGDVKRPSGVSMDNSSDMTVLQAIAMAEGTNPTAALNKAKLIRRTQGGPPQELPLALKDMLASKAPDLRLQAEDIIFVPTSAAKSATRRSLEAIIQTATGLAIYRP
jgi:polysaccharide biosynthesis/export protein